MMQCTPEIKPRTLAHLLLQLLASGLHEVGVSGVRRVSSLEGVHHVGPLLLELIAHLNRGLTPLVETVVVPGNTQGNKKVTSDCKTAPKNTMGTVRTSHPRVCPLVGDTKFIRNDHKLLRLE